MLILLRDHPPVEPHTRVTTPIATTQDQSEKNRDRITRQSCQGTIPIFSPLQRRTEDIIGKLFPALGESRQSLGLKRVQVVDPVAPSIGRPGLPPPQCTLDVVTRQSWLAKLAPGHRHRKQVIRIRIPAAGGEALIQRLDRLGIEARPKLRDSQRVEVIGLSWNKPRHATQTRDGDPKRRTRPGRARFHPSRVPLLFTNTPGH